MLFCFWHFCNIIMLWRKSHFRYILWTKMKEQNSCSWLLYSWNKTILLMMICIMSHRIADGSSERYYDVFKRSPIFVRVGCKCKCNCIKEFCKSASKNPYFFREDKGNGRRRDEHEIILKPFPCFQFQASCSCNNASRIHFSVIITSCPLFI